MKLLAAGFLLLILSACGEVTCGPGREFRQVTRISREGKITQESVCVEVTKPFVMPQLPTRPTFPTIPDLPNN